MAKEENRERQRCRQRERFQKFFQSVSLLLWAEIHYPESGGSCQSYCHCNFPPALAKTVIREASDGLGTVLFCASVSWSQMSTDSLQPLLPPQRLYLNNWKPLRIILREHFVSEKKLYLKADVKASYTVHKRLLCVYSCVDIYFHDFSNKMFRAIWRCCDV